MSTQTENKTPIWGRDTAMIKHWDKVMKRLMRKKIMTAADWQQYHLAAHHKKLAEETPINMSTKKNENPNR